MANSAGGATVPVTVRPDAVTLLCGDAGAVLDTLPARSVHTCITSPSYFGLRDYGCAGQIGLEGTPQEYVAALVAVFRGVKRVLRDDGTLWLVLGDSYWSNTATQGRNESKSPATSHLKNDGRRLIGARHYEQQQRGLTYQRRAIGLKPKDLCGIPWRVAFALQDDAWLLRQELIWHKPNPMPESVKDRCTRAHETVFMLAKSPRYYFDQEAIREPASERTWYYPASLTVRAKRAGATPVSGGTNAASSTLGSAIHATGRNRRSVWSCATSPLSSKKYGVQTEHYAAFPPELVRPMVLAGCPPDGVVLDCFMGSGTTGLVAVQEGRRFMGIDLNPQYVDLARRRIATAQPPLALAL